MPILIRFAPVILLCHLLIVLSSCSAGDSSQPVEQEQPEPVSTVQAEEPLSVAADNFLENEQTLTLDLPVIGIYTGDGSWTENVIALKNFLTDYDFQWRAFDSEDAVSDLLYRDVEMLIFPGGFAAEYRYNIKNHDMIRSFVESGGSYVGICAGAYYAADIFEWQGTAYDYPLSLFPGTAAGPLTGKLNWGDLAELVLESGVEPNEGFSDQIAVYYFDGPYFKINEHTEKPFQVLARYSDNNQAAVVAGSFGKGRYLLLGPHPELGRYDPERPPSDYTAEDGAQWPWLYSLLLWLHETNRG